jgi:hypothetical protein
LLNRVERPAGVQALDRLDLWPAAVAASTVHDLTGSPSISTMQVPQFEVSQPQCGPAGQAELIPEEVHEQHPWLHIARVLAGVHLSRRGSPVL